MRPTGRLHIGHYFGALSNWIRMQEEYDCFYFVADWHALTTHYADTSEVARNTFEIATDWLAAGLDPEKCTIFVQSLVPEHAELHLLLSMVTPLGWLERVPTYKEQIEQLKDKDLHTYGFLGYPLLQAADIVMYGDPPAELLVPVGEDQVPHVELTREIVRRFNLFYLRLDPQKLSDPQYEAYGTLLDRLASMPFQFRWESAFSAEGVVQLQAKLRSLAAKGIKELDEKQRAEGIAYSERMMRIIVPQVGLENFLEKEKDLKRFFLPGALREPAAMLTETPRLPGLDGRRMAKSYGNFILLSEESDSIRAKVRNMMTDPQRVRRTDPGRPEVCPVFAYHKLFSEPETIAWSDQGCRTAGIGCIECKAAMAEGLVRWIEPIRARRRQYEANPEQVREILHAGSKKAQKVARRTMRRVREAIFGRSGSLARAAKAASGAARKAQGALGS